MVAKPSAMVEYQGSLRWAGGTRSLRRLADRSQADRSQRNFSGWEVAGGVEGLCACVQVHVCRVVFALIS